MNASEATDAAVGGSAAAPAVGRIPTRPAVVPPGICSLHTRIFSPPLQRPATALAAPETWWRTAGSCRRPQGSPSAMCSHSLTLSARTCSYCVVLFVMPWQPLVNSVRSFTTAKRSILAGLLRRSSMSAAGHRHTNIRQATGLQTTLITTSSAGIDTSALTHCVMQRRRSVRHPGRSGSEWGTRVSAFQSCRALFSASSSRSRRSRCDQSRQSAIEFDGRLPTAVGMEPATMSSRRLACIRYAARASAEDHQPWVLSWRRAQGRSPQGTNLHLWAVLAIGA